jgi:hypothetical protein
MGIPPPREPDQPIDPYENDWPALVAASGLGIPFHRYFRLYERASAMAANGYEAEVLLRDAVEIAREHPAAAAAFVAQARELINNPHRLPKAGTRDHAPHGASQYPTRASLQAAIDAAWERCRDCRRDRAPLQTEVALDVFPQYTREQEHSAASHLGRRMRHELRETWTAYRQRRLGR